MKVLSVVGARPQFVKLAPIAWQLARRGHEHLIVHTGQHYDHLLSQSFFDELSLPPPDVNLEAGSGGQAEQTSRILAALDPVLARERPDWVLTYGDTNSTLAGTLAAAARELPIAHLEAGLRSFDRTMPEERNRIVADHLAALLLAPTTVAMDNLAAEGLTTRSLLVGDLMVDTLRVISDQWAAPGGERPSPSFTGHRGRYLLATIHRQATTDDPDRLGAVVAALAACPKHVRLLVHPRLAARARQFGIALSGGSLRASDPLPYRSMIAALAGADGLITDSGGLQKEALVLGVPCSTLRAETEWPETLQGGWNVLVTDPGELPTAVARPRPAGEPPTPFGDGEAAVRIIDVLASRAHDAPHAQYTIGCGRAAAAEVRT
ncbi:UDP-N-acetylglucosamine 2-epimerase (non-hydrolyzing) [Streptomyces sp. B4I13]|uniref:non-hydrolyzing UDP-N-acetylglucosamine 2-epimerase n=1 Tax=Streptomyces sp. B4I13 TaxID=3042271 RepID=UPI0027825C69|nr:UDP-N-acetylglucosamine 2-epimerase (non-hydrolyzing) [Streptomyces sp. B4I13]MDQ0956284.1 UDP-N-acetylglucosamine 2-epimerase (non-hydrolyzing) [Streptomyces sp. B4I13]